MRAPGVGVGGGVAELWVRDPRGGGECEGVDPEIRVWSMACGSHAVISTTEVYPCPVCTKHTVGQSSLIFKRGEKRNLFLF